MSVFNAQEDGKVLTAITDHLMDRLRDEIIPALKKSIIDEGLADLKITILVEKVQK